MSESPPHVCLSLMSCQKLLLLWQQLSTLQHPNNQDWSFCLLSVPLINKSLAHVAPLWHKQTQIMTAWQPGGKRFITVLNFGPWVGMNPQQERACSEHGGGFSLLGQFGLVLRVPSKRRNEPVVKINAAIGTNYSIWMIWADLDNTPSLRRLKEKNNLDLKALRNDLYFKIIFDVSSIKKNRFGGKGTNSLLSWKQS